MQCFPRVPGDHQLKKLSLTDNLLLILSTYFIHENPGHLRPEELCIPVGLNITTPIDIPENVDDASSHAPSVEKPRAGEDGWHLPKSTRLQQPKEVRQRTKNQLHTYSGEANAICHSSQTPECWRSAPPKKLCSGVCNSHTKRLGCETCEPSLVRSLLHHLTDGRNLCFEVGDNKGGPGRKEL